MSKNEIKLEINKVLDHFSDKALNELLSFLKTLDAKHGTSVSLKNPLDKVLREDKDLLAKLAQ